MRLIDADELKEWVANWLKMDRYYHPYATNNNIPINELEDIIERMPTVDAVPVIRCKDCRYVGTDATCCLVCNREGMGLRPFHVYHDDFCSYAERKEECGQRSAD